MPLLLYNTLTRRKEELKPLVDGNVGMYVCGPTVYGHSHIGHAKSYVSFDTIVRYLRYRGYKVTYVQNITDVGHLLGDTNEGEDRLLRQGKIEQKHPMEIAEFYAHSYFDDMDALNVLRPDISPRATGHIIEQIELIRKLVESGFAYEVNGSVYFDVAKDRDYGKLSGRSTDEAESGTRVEVKSEKKNPNDFALWKKAAAEHIMQWPSPWGVGFPGWHIECSAMSMKYLGMTFDIHGGGMDNQFPHHECEIAQSECATGKPFVKYWIHNNLVTVSGQKMSKSLGNVIMLKEAFMNFSPVKVRFFILQSHYRSTLDFTNEALEGAAKGLEKLLNTLRNVELQLANSSRTTNGGMDAGIDTSKIKASFLEAMDDDFNTPQAIAVLFDFSRELNTALASGSLSAKSLLAVRELFNELAGSILGIVPDEKTSQSTTHTVSTNPRARIQSPIDDDMIHFLVELRRIVREHKLWSLSDKIRDELHKRGIIIEDKKAGVAWRRES